jgi:hypothetical protein
MKNGHNANIVFNENDKGIAAVYGLSLYREDDEQPEDAAEEIANANLIAAAPELYEALEELYEFQAVDISVPRFFKQFEAVMAKAHAALKKARGE